ncbi:MAG: ribosome maturation factor RimP [Vicinamibacteria bacterium]|jgi:ribosome maturation factor RimP|nr:ribosome maturation factor RimP [Vicinamibacteria bacterium]
MRTGVLETIRAIASRVTASHAMELVDVEMKREQGRSIVRVSADKTGGIGIADLTLLTEEISAILDAEDPLGSRYYLEVSSPGLDRPLRSATDFERALQKLIVVVLQEAHDERRRFTGRLIAQDEMNLTLAIEAEGGREVALPKAKIAEARLEPLIPRKNGKPHGKHARPDRHHKYQTD